ncbi:Dam family site-specific DNA-(adenine-N6)-methyltransferase (plasmid) [Cupriavidus pinatubonensis]|uniref:DNA adenine methylase n=1 Tax=Cupriavidus pinatubonensis TaxID=248026 RepID=UPI001C72E575|nr:Dam family site-specific DNA-(adenine-N6)-methyltransferase [Cupriavidus pinatubonensis]QYY33769.1 Dam family site-specific DNA-(adenine-N6)-methyltransferase [Cupriavidus pinatubonensis]
MAHPTKNLAEGPSSPLQPSMDPILRWAGSKRKVLTTLRGVSPPSFERYIEPFAGSAVLYFDLLPDVAVLGDLNPEVVATYSAIRDSAKEVCDYLSSIPKTKEAYYTLRELKPELLTESQRAARLIFLMKACFNGVYRTNRNGKFNVPLGSHFYALPSAEDLISVSNQLKNTKLVCGDFATTIGEAREGDFIYLDPPYSDGTRFRGEYSYKGAFQAPDLQRLISICRELTKRRVKILLSFKEHEELSINLSGWTVKKIAVTRSVAGFTHSRRTAREILAYNF